MMKTRKKKLVSGLAIVLMVACVLMIAVALTSNLLFSSRQSTPHLLGHDIYLNTEPMMEPVVSKDAAVRIEQINKYAVGDVVLYQNTAGVLHISRIARVDSAPAEEGAALTLDVINTLGQTEALTLNDVLGRCKDENVTLGKALLFVTSKLGIVLLLVLPSLLLLIYVISRFVAAAQDDDEEPIPVLDGKSPAAKRTKKPQSPLFMPEEAARKDKEFAEKKASLAEHFSQKSSDTVKLPRQKRKEKEKEKYDIEAGKRALEETVAARQKKQSPKPETPAAEIHADVDDRVATIKHAMEQRAQERRRQEEEEAQIIAASKAKATRDASEIAREPAPARPAPTSASANPVPTQPQAAETRPQPSARPTPAAQQNPRPAAPRPQRPARPAAPRPSSSINSFEELMAKLDEEKNKLNGSR